MTSPRAWAEHKRSWLAHESQNELHPRPSSNLAALISFRLVGHGSAEKDPRRTRRVKDKTPFVAHARSRMKSNTTPLDCSQVGAGSPFFRFFLVSMSCCGFIGWRDRGLAEKMTRWDKELVLALHVDSIMLHCLDYTMKQLRNETASLAVKIMPRPIHGFTRSTDKTTPGKERMWSSKQAAVMVFEEATTIIKICTSSYTAKFTLSPSLLLSTFQRQPVFRPSEKSGDYGRLGLRADD
ncbi:hypothetical protein C8J56DRAFT_897735 [Mycena floridula]|nr:hypothetical protein C8J56DRAFT_897735 [Mycena floridula]